MVFKLFFFLKLYKLVAFRPSGFELSHLDQVTTLGGAGLFTRLLRSSVDVRTSLNGVDITEDRQQSAKVRPLSSLPSGFPWCVSLWARLSLVRLPPAPDECQELLNHTRHPLSAY